MQMPSVQIGLKCGGGVGRKGDFGYLYAGYVMEPFKNALRYVMSSNKSPWRCCSFFTQLWNHPCWVQEVLQSGWRQGWHPVLGWACSTSSHWRFCNEFRSLLDTYSETVLLFAYGSHEWGCYTDLHCSSWFLSRRPDTKRTKRQSHGTPRSPSTGYPTVDTWWQEQERSAIAMFEGEFCLSPFSN